jgi:hypothetical protein
MVSPVEPQFATVTFWNVWLTRSFFLAGRQPWNTYSAHRTQGHIGISMGLVWSWPDDNENSTIPAGYGAETMR